MKVRRGFLLTLLGIALVGLFAMRIANSADKAMSDTGYLGADQWYIRSNGDMVPETANSQDLGSAASEIANIYLDAITLNTVEKTSWGSIVSPWTDEDGYTTLTDGGTDTIMWDDGDITLGGNTAADVVTIWDCTQDFYIGVEDAIDSLEIGFGSVIGTTNMITFPAARTFFIGDGTANDFGYYFDGNGADFYIGMDDAGGESANDYFVMGAGSTIATSPALGIDQSGIVYVDALTSPGSADLDIGESGCTSVDVETDGGLITLDGIITMPNDEIISNATDGTIMVQDEAGDTIFEIYTQYDTEGDATLMLSSDVKDAAGEIWTITSTGATQDLVFGCDDTTPGTQDTTLTIADDGIITTINYIDAKITDTATTAVTDVLHLTHDGGVAAAGVGVGLVFQVDDASAIEEQGSIDVSLSTVTNGSEDADFIVRLNTEGDMREVLRIDTDEAAAGTSVLEFTGWSQGTSAVIDQVEFVAETSGNTSTDGFGMGIVFKLEDEDDAVEEHASMDIILTDAGSSAEDCDIAFTQSVNSTATASLLLDADAGLDLRVSGWDLIFPGDETIDNDTANTLTVRSNDEATTLTVMGFTDKAAKLILDSDLGADTADTWTLEAEDGGDLTLDNGSSEILTISSAGSLLIASDLSIVGGDIDTGSTARMSITTNSKAHKYHYYPISYGTAATVARVGGGAEPLLCAGLAGAEEIGSTTGFATLVEDADFLRFRFALPETFIDTGTATDLLIQFYISPNDVTNDAITYDVNIYVSGNAFSSTPIVTDTVTVHNTDSAGWFSLTTLATGFGDQSLGPEDVLIITVSPQTECPYELDHDGDFYSCRIKYVAGIEVTQ